MQNKIDLTKILKPGDKVYSCITGNMKMVQSINCNVIFPIGTEDGMYYTKDGRLNNTYEHGECLIWPDKDTRTWGNHCPFKKGDIVLVWDCYEIHRANMPQYGCTKQCDECAREQAVKNLKNKDNGK